MGRDVLSVRQMMVLLIVGLLAPAVDLLPGIAARGVGRGGWLMGLGALPLLLAAQWAAAKVFGSGDICGRLGKPGGYTIIIIYMVWIWVALIAVFRLSAARLENIYGVGPAALLVAVLAAISVRLGMGKAAALARAAEIFYLALAVVAAGILLMAVFKVEGRNLWPVEWTAVPGGSVAAVGLLLNGMPAAVLVKRVPKGNKSRGCGWMVAFCVTVTLLLAAVIGCVGPGLCGRLEMPFYIMVQGLGIKGAFQRTEALVAALWLTSDLVLASVLLRGWCDYVGEICSGVRGRWSALAVAALALVGGWLLFPTGEDVRRFSGTILPALGIGLGLTLPIFCVCFMKIREKKGG